MIWRIAMHQAAQIRGLVSASEVSLQETARAAPAGTGRDPQVDRLVGAISTENSTLVEIAATVALSNDGWCGDGDARVSGMTPQITLIKKCGPNPLMSKKIFIDEQ